MSNQILKEVDNFCKSVLIKSAGLQPKEQAEFLVSSILQLCNYCDKKQVIQQPEEETIENKEKPINELRNRENLK